MQGLRVGVTGARKGGELVAALERRGALVTWGPTLAPDQPESDAQLLVETRTILDAAPGWLVLSTGVGVRMWVEAAGRLGHGEALLRLLRATPTLARGSKAWGALRTLGVEPVFVSPLETDADVVAWLQPRVRASETVAVQLHGAGGLAEYQALESQGARLLSVTPYRCELPDELGAAKRLILDVLDGRIDVLVATSATAARNLLAIAAQMELESELVAALRPDRGVVVAAVGPVTAEALEDLGVPVGVMPKRARTGELIRSIEGWAQRRELVTWPAGTGAIELVPHLREARAGDLTVVLGEREFGVLAALVRRPGIACSQELLAREAFGHDAPDDLSVVKHHVLRIRRKLGPWAATIQTVRGVGYRYLPHAISGYPTGEQRRGA